MKKKSAGKNYVVGRGKPPIQSRFEKGKSGNPSGRPKKKPTFADAVEKLLTKKQSILIDGERKSLTLEELLMTSVMQNAIRCKNSKSIEIAMSWVAMVHELRLERQKRQPEFDQKALREKLKTMTYEEKIELYNRTIDEQHSKEDDKY